MGIENCWRAGGRNSGNGVTKIEGRFSERKLDRGGAMKIRESDELGNGIGGGGDIQNLRIMDGQWKFGRVGRSAIEIFIRREPEILQEREEGFVDLDGKVGDGRNGEMGFGKDLSGR